MGHFLTWREEGVVPVEPTDWRRRGEYGGLYTFRVYFVSILSLDILFIHVVEEDARQLQKSIVHAILTLIQFLCLLLLFQ